MYKLLPKSSRVKNVTHHPAIFYSEVPTFMTDLTTIGSTSALVLQFLILTATRTSEALQAKREELT
ncbi:MAG: hypothetical protein ABW130_00615 [Candidatus Thiodiazotropha lotti]